MKYVREFINWVLLCEVNKVVSLPAGGYPVGLVGYPVGLVGYPVGLVGYPVGLGLVG